MNKKSHLSFSYKDQDVVSASKQDGKRNMNKFVKKKNLLHKIA